MSPLSNLLSPVTRLGSIMLVMMLSACGNNLLINPQIPPLPAPDAAPTLYAPPMEEEYHVQVGDQLLIRSYYDSQLNQEAVVRRDGRISLLLVNDVVVVGKTTNELSEYLTAQYSKHVRASEVTVSIVESAGLTVYVGGEVRVSSQQPLSGPLTVVQAITAAGGLKPTANSNQVIVLRRQDNGRFVAYQLDMDKVLVNQAADVYLQRYDIVHVPMTQIAHINKFVDQYINQIIPDALRFNGSYTWIDEVGGSDTPTRFEVVSP